MLRGFDPVGRPRAEIAVDDSGRKTRLAQGLRHRLCREHRPVFAPGAAKGDPDMPFALPLIGRDQRQQEVADLPENIGKRRIAADMVAHRGVEPCLLYTSPSPRD